VHRAVLDDGTVVAVKVQRARARAQIDRDLSLFAAGAWVLDKLPRMRWVSLPGAVERFGAALRAQLDFGQEAANNRRLAANFRGDACIRVPRLYDTLCARRVLTMEFVDGVKPTEVVEGRAELAQAGLRCIAQMVFIDGFVHADMHPGNLMFTRDGHVYLIDLGLVAEIPEPMRKPWVETFVAVAACDGRRAAELFYTYAPAVQTADYAAYEADVVAHLEKFRGRPLAELEVTTSVGGAMAILRRHGVQVDPTFTVVQLAMLVAEGVGKQLDPGIDVYASVGPYLAQAAMRWTEGAAPRRTVPHAAAT
jgi:ubiquinone biosynthesis protein